LGECRGDDHIAQHAVVKLHGERILEKVEIPGRGLAETIRHEGAVDQRPGVEAKAGIETSDKGTGKKLQEHQQENCPGNPCGGA
jgi:hypothetical protein